MNKMNSDNEKIKANIYEVGQLMRLNKKDMKHILNSISSRYEQPAIAAGPRPPEYLSSLYGTISTKDFQ